MKVVKEIPQNERKDNSFKKSYSQFDCEKRSRLFSLVTYATEPQISNVLGYHHESIKRYAFILHDKDLKEDGSPKENHFHILIETYNALTISTVRNWFCNCRDENDSVLSTLGQIVSDRILAAEYLTHEHNPEKYHYRMEDVYNLPDLIGITGQAPRDDEDPALSIINDLLKGKSTWDMIRRYGREYIINGAKYRDCIQQMLQDNSIPKRIDGTEIDKNEMRFKFFY